MAEETTTTPETKEATNNASIDTVASATDAEATGGATAAKPATPKRKKAKRSVPSGQVHVQATFNNTIITDI